MIDLSKPILIALALAVVLTPVGSALMQGTVHVTFEARQIQFFDDCDGVFQEDKDCEPKVHIDGVGESNCGGQHGENIANCGASFTWAMNHDGEDIIVQMEDIDGGNPDDPIDISADGDSSDDDVTITIVPGANAWTQENDVDLGGCGINQYAVAFGTWCKLGKNTDGDHDEGSVEIRITCSDCQNL